MIDKLEAPALTRTNRHTMKAQVTDSAARAIIETEAAKREAKTLRLRAARLKAEAEAPVVPAVQKVRKTAGKR